MQEIQRKLCSLSPGDVTGKMHLLSDLAELLTKLFISTDACNDFSFHDSEIATLAETIGNVDVEDIVCACSSVLLNTAEEPNVRSAAAFVLGKSRNLMALRQIVGCLRSPCLPPVVSKQLAFSYDLLAEIDPTGESVPSDIGSLMSLHGIPWDSLAKRIVVDLL